MMHEVGHTLGLRHNFRASTALHARAARDPAFTEAQRHLRLGDGLQRRINLATAAASTQGEPAQRTLGPYDYWAIEYALPAVRRAAAGSRRARQDRRAQHRARARLRRRRRRRRLRRSDGLDPLANRFDLGDDPLPSTRSASRCRASCGNALQARGQKPGDDPLRARRVLLSRPPPAARHARAGRQVHRRHERAARPARDQRPADRSRPVDAAKQREALQFLAERHLQRRQLPLPARVPARA